MRVSDGRPGLCEGRGRVWVCLKGHLCVPRVSIRLAVDLMRGCLWAQLVKRAHPPVAECARTYE